jgi:hypothetical protein
MALTDAYIKAAKEPNREPVTVVTIESADGVNIDYSSQNDWEGSDTLTNVDTLESAGDVIPKKNQVTASHKTYSSIQGASFVLTYDAYLAETWLNVIWGYALTGLVQQARIVLYDGDPATANQYILDEFTISGTSIGSGFAETGPILLDAKSGPEFSSGTEIFLTVQIFNPPADVWMNGILSATLNVVTPLYYLVKPTAQVVTSVLSFDVKPTTSPIISIDDVLESGASITYSVKGGDTLPPSVVITGTGPGDSVKDGDALTPYKHYEVTADFSTTNGGRGIIRGISLNEGIFRYYGSHRGFPFAGIQSVLPAKAVSTLAQKIDPNKGVATIGQVNFKLLQTPETDDMLDNGYLAGKDVRVWSGFRSLSSLEDFRPILTGTWQDFDIDNKGGFINVKVRDMLKQFAKRELPEHTYNASTGARETSPIAYTNANVVTVIKNLFDRLGIRGRYSHPDYDTLEAGALSSSDFNVTRTLTEAIDVDKLLDQLAQTAGLFLVPSGDGRLTPKLQASVTPTVTLDVRNYKTSAIKGNQGELITRLIARYNATKADPGNDEDYAAGYQLIDSVAEALYDPEKATRTWLDEWAVGSVSGGDLSAPPQALIDWCERQLAWFSEPRFSFDLSDVPPYVDVEAGDVIGITGLKLPITMATYDAGTTYAIGVKVISAGRVYRSKVDANTGNTPASSPTQWQDQNVTADGLTDNKPFLITAFNFDTNDAMTKLSLREQAET